MIWDAIDVIVPLSCYGRASRSLLSWSDYQLAGEKRTYYRGIVLAQQSPKKTGTFLLLWLVGLQNDELYSVAKRDVQQGAERVSKLTGHAFGGITEEAGKGDDSEGIHGKDKTRR